MLPFSQVDVFTDSFLSGNPVAVVHGGEHLPDETLAAFARWTNLSETTFLLPPNDPAADYRLRIFTTGRELPFAGHPTLGSARAWLDAGGAPATPGQLVQQCTAGLIRLRQDGTQLAFAAPPLVRGGPLEPSDVDLLTHALGLDPGQVLDAQWCDNGPGWVALLLEDAATVLRVHPEAAALGPLRHVGVIGRYPGSGGPDGAEFEVRAFVADPEVKEDPVTGSLNAALAQWLIPAGHAPSSYIASQGTVLQRHGRVHVQQDGADFWIGGDTVIGIRGNVEL